MEYRYLGRTGILVSALSFGTMDPFCSAELIKKCVDVGINFFDTAEIYSNGESERALGKAIREAGI